MKQQARGFEYRAMGMSWNLLENLGKRQRKATSTHAFTFFRGESIEEKV